MFSFESDAFLVDDREDLINVLQMRFGGINGAIIERIYEIDDMNTLQHLILAAANAVSWDVFVEELSAGERSFRILGENFNPLGEFVERRGDINGKGQK
ncbi:MAG: hypothetical protein Q8935_02705 [Bacillota bacterium]|nr:hypothetical protein [Bacillota bacterium]MDP4154375.1 hypothetical protein [Bacillota bacterium]